MGLAMQARSEMLRVYSPDLFDATDGLSGTTKCPNDVNDAIDACQPPTRRPALLFESAPIISLLHL